MKYLNGENYVEVKDHRYIFHPTEIIILRKRDPPTCLRTQYQVQNETQIKRNQKEIENKRKEREVKIYPKNKQPIVQQRKNNSPSCPCCKRNNWPEVDIGYFCQNCEHIINKQKHKIDKKIRRQDHDFSARLKYASKKIREIWMNMINKNYISTEVKINKLQELKGKTKLKFYKKISNYFDNMNIRMDEDPFARNAQDNSKIYHEVLVSMKFSQTKPQVKNMSNI